jgi:hypothetical protein
MRFITRNYFYRAVLRLTFAATFVWPAFAAGTTSIHDLSGIWGRWFNRAGPSRRHRRARYAQGAIAETGLPDGLQERPPDLRAAIAHPAPALVSDTDLKNPLFLIRDLQGFPHFLP